MTTLPDSSSRPCPPRLATPRRPERPTLGPKLGEVAAALGQPLMPWQQYVADVALELLPDGKPAYRTIVLTVPRQSGKSTLLLSLFITRCLAWKKPQKCSYGAQNGVAAREKLMVDFVPALEQSPIFGKMVNVTRTNGHEAITFHNGSRIDLMAGTEKAGHGKTLDLGLTDEAFSFTDDRVDQAVIPAMSTRRDAQHWIVSTMGTSQSSYLNHKVEVGRASLDDPKSRIAYFEWSAEPGADPDDEETWYSCMPALGRTIDLDVVYAARQSLTDGEFRRAYLNQLVNDEDLSGGFPREDWEACVDPKSAPKDPVAFAIDVSPGAGSAAIAACGIRDDGREHVEVIDHRLGTSWLPERVVELVGRWNPAVVVLDPGGPAGAVLPALERAGVTVKLLSGRDRVMACGGIHRAVIEHDLVHRDDAALNAAVTGAVKRSAGDAWVWNRANSTVDICPLVAVTLAHFARVSLEMPPVYDISASIF